jgi:nucleoside-diphosphate-sugar epimerase
VACQRASHASGSPAGGIAGWLDAIGETGIVHILVTGAAGMIGRKLVARLMADGHLGGRQITALSLVDVVPPEKPAGAAVPVQGWAGDLSEPGAAARCVEGRPDVIYHLAAIVSGEAEADFEKGYRVNLDGTRALFEAVRQQGLKAPYKPRLVFASSIAVFGAPFPDTIGDEFLNAPLTSYGTQKAIGELLLSDYSRRGFFDGIGIRLPTICIRPGKPNKAASGFFSSILREPLAGQEAVLPVSEDVRHWHASPRAAVGFLLHAAAIDLSQLGGRRNLSMPGLSATVGEQIAALREVAGEKAVKLIRHEPDPVIARIVEGWPRKFDARRALALGFKAENSFRDIIRAHIEDELNGKLP